MNLPHLEPVKFAQEIRSIEADTLADVYCTFPETPTLAMLFEAAAQSSVAFSNQAGQIGYVIAVKDLKLFTKPTSTSVIVSIRKERTIQTISEFSFNVSDAKTETKYSSGALTVMLEDS